MSLEAGGGIPCRPNPAATLLVYIYTSLFHQRNGSSKNTYNIINKKNTISKHKVNMTVISLVKNMTIKL